MSLFDEKEFEHIFNPLCCVNKRLYYDCIVKLIEMSKSIPLLYETDARDCIIVHIRNCKYGLVDENGVTGEYIISNNKSDSDNASAMINYFRDCGWLAKKEIGRNGDNIATVTSHCRRLIGAIQRIFERDTTGALTNHIFAIYDTLKSAFDPDTGRSIRPYTNILIPLIDNISDLKNEILSLKDSIRTIMNSVIKISEVRSFGQYMIKDEIMNSFFNDYFFIKKDGIIPIYIAEIENMLGKILSTDVYKKIIDEYSRLYNVDEDSAKEVISQQFSEMQGFISYDYVKEMDFIDKRINSYYNLYSTRMLMLISNNTNMQSYLNKLLTKIKNMNTEEQGIAIEKISECFKIESYKFIGPKSIERKHKKTPNTKSGAIFVSKLSDEERLKLTNEVLSENPDKYSMKRTTAYLNNTLGNKKEIEITNDNLKTRPDAMMIAASIIYSGTEGFPYEVEFLEGMIENDNISASKIKIKRKVI